MKRLVLIILVIAVTIVGGALALLIVRVNQPYKGFDGPEQYVEVPAGSGVASIARRLTQAGVVRDPVTFRYAVWLIGGATTLKAGEYRFDRAMTPEEVARKLARGDVYLRQITFREGLSIRDMAALFEQHGFGPRQAFVDAASRPDAIRGLDPEAADLEGYLFPDTYALPRRATAEKLVQMMVSRFQKQVGGDLPQRAAAAGMSVHEAMTLASIVERRPGGRRSGRSSRRYTPTV